MFDMLTGAPPFSADSKRETQHRVLHDQIRLPTYLSTEAKDLLKKLLKRTPTSRLGAGERDADEIKVLSRFIQKLILKLCLGAPMVFTDRLAFIDK